MTIAIAAPEVAVTRGWPGHLGILAGVALALLLIFHTDAAALAHIWWTSTTFGHCLFIAPVIVWLAWQRRHELARLSPTGWAPGLAIVAVGSAAWLVGDAAGVSFARHFGLVLMLQGATVTLLGPNVARGLAFPLAYAWFLVPFGEGLEEPLQSVTVGMVMPLLHLAGVPAQVDGVLITIPNGYFEVAEACSGAKFVIAMAAFGALVANVCFVSWRRRALFVVASLIVPVLANGVRAFATIYVAHLTSVARATGYDHIVYGWIFFGLVMAATLALGWRWFDRAPDAPAFDPAALDRPVRARLRLPVAAAATLAVAMVGPAWSHAVAGRTQPLPASVVLPAVRGWHRVPLSVAAPWQPFYPGADHFVFGRYADAAGDAVDLSIALFAQQREGAKLFAFGTGVLREEDRWVRVADEPAIAGGAVTRITASGSHARPVVRLVASWYRVGTVTTADPRTVKLHTLAARLLGGPQRAAAVHLSAIAEPGHDPRAAITGFRAALGEPGVAADHMAGLR